MDSCPSLNDTPTWKELLEVFAPLVDWRPFAIRLPCITSTHIETILYENGTKVFNEKSALFLKWLDVYPKGTWNDVILALLTSGNHEIMRRVIRHCGGCVEGQSLPGCDKVEEVPFSEEEEEVISQSLGCNKVEEVRFLEEEEKGINRSLGRNAVEEFQFSEEDERVVIRSLQDLHKNFTILMMKVQDALSKRAMLETVVMCAQTYFNSLDGHQFNVVGTSSSDPFKRISHYYDFLDCELIVNVAEILLDGDPLVAKLNEHKEQANRFRQSTTIAELKKQLKIIYGSVKRNFEGIPKIRIRLQEEWHELNIDRLKKLVKSLLPVDQRVSLMRHITIESGSVCISYAVFNSTPESIITHVEQKLEFVQFIGAFSLSVNEHVILPSVGENKNFTFELAFHNAAEVGHVEAVEFLLQLEQVDVNCVNNETGNTALILASQNGHNQVVKLLLELGHTNVNIKNQDGVTALMLASQNEHLQVVELLLKDRPRIDVDIQTPDGQTALTLSKNPAMVHLLKRHSHSLISKYQHYSPDELSEKCLVAFEKGNYSEAFDLLALIDKLDPILPILLYLATKNGWVDIMNILITIYHLNPQARDEKGRTCFHYVKHIDTVKYLFHECKCDPMVTDKEGMTPIHHAAASAWLTDVLQYLINACNCDPMVTDEKGRTPLHLAVARGSSDVLQYLIDACNCDPMVTDKRGMTPLHHAAASTWAAWHTDVLQYLINKCSCDLMVADEKGMTSLHYFKDFMGPQVLIWCLNHIFGTKILPILKYLINKCNCDPMVTDKEGMTLLHHAAASGHTDVLQFLINESNCDPMVTDKKGMTPLLYFANFMGPRVLIWCLNHILGTKTLLILKYLIDKCNCDPMVTNQDESTPLHIAVITSAHAIVEYLLSTGKCDPFAEDKDGNTPLILAYKDSTILQIINRFKHIKISHPVDSYVNVLLLGNPGAGKSTLNKVISDTATKTRSTCTVFGARTVKGVEVYTAGIIPTKLQHKQLGNVILHDFAGHSEYYSSHSAVIENLLKCSAGVFVVVVNMTEKEALKHLQQCLTVVRNKAQKAFCQCRIIVVASHKDEIGGKVARRRKKEEMQEIITERYGNEDVVFVSLDCRKLDGPNITSFFESLSNACQFIRSTSKRNLTLYCHMMYGLLEEMKQNVVTLSNLIDTANGKNLDYVIPKEREEIMETLFQLHSTGLICLLTSEDEVWVVVNKKILLAEVNKILFAPKAFEQHRKEIASNTGIITVATLSQLFSNYDTNMLICFLKTMALCQEINLHFRAIAIPEQSFGSSNERLLFFPALLDVGRPSAITSQVYQFGWCLKCTNKHHFFPPRYFHVLSLQLAYTFIISSPSTDALNRYYTFWRNGFHWFNSHGIGTLVEMVNDSQCVLVLMSSKERYRENMVSARREVIGEIKAVYKESCPSLEVEEFFIDPQELDYPIDNPTERAVYSVQAVLNCIKEGKPFVTEHRDITNIPKQRKPEDLLPEERITDLTILSRLLGPDIKDTDSLLKAISLVRPEMQEFHLKDVKPDIAHIVLTESKSKLQQSIGLEYLSEKMFEKHIMSDTKKREVFDRMSDLTVDQRMDLLLDKLRATVKTDGSIFGWFIQVLIDYGTVLSVKTADELMTRCYELIQQSNEEEFSTNLRELRETSFNFSDKNFLQKPDIKELTCELLSASSPLQVTPEVKNTAILNITEPSNSLSISS